MSATKEYHHDKIEEGQRKAIADTRDYPILFDTEMVQAILSGTKTATRRLFKSPLSIAMEPAHEIWHDGGEWITRLKNGQCLKYPIVCPYGEPGDYLWVKETWAPAFSDIAYKADYSEEVLSEKRNQGLWHPSIHMPKTAARLWLQITDIKAQRIQTVTEEEAREEGTKPAEVYGMGEIGKKTFREGFIAKWHTIYGIEKYFENPWVWAIKFIVADSKPSIIL
jgi:hypothetical protein